MLTTFKADVKKLPGGLQVEANARGFKILLDEPADLGGTDKGMNPVEAVLCALGACQTICAAAFAFLPPPAPEREPRSLQAAPCTAPPQVRSYQTFSFHVLLLVSK